MLKNVALILVVKKSRKMIRIIVGFSHDIFKNKILLLVCFYIALVHFKQDKTFAFIFK